MTPLEKMIADSRICNSKLKSNSKVIHTPDSTDSRGNVTRAFDESPNKTKLTNQQIQDVKYFLNLGWCVRSTGTICNVNFSQVQKIRNSQVNS